MFLSAKKYLEESAKSATSGADQLITHTRGIINTVKVYEYCNKCNTQINMLGNYLTSQNQCRMCSKVFCNACIAKSSVNVPNHLLDITFQNKTAHAQPERQFLCLHRCTPRVINACMQAFRKEITCRFEDYVQAFLQEESKQHFFFPIPSASPEDTAYRKALRMIHIAGVVAGMTGYAMTYNAVKYAYYSSELVNILTEGGILGILTPLLESLKECGIGITGPTAMMRLYYLGCYHTLQSKIDTSRRSLLYEEGKEGVLYSECPLSVLQYVNSYLSAAQWMYLSSLPPPHQDNDWGSWYLSQIIRRQGWSLLMCINESTKIPDGSKCPAFALVTRCVESVGSESGDSGEPQREAMLVIRGSNSIMDWSINLEDEMCDYVFTHIVDGVSWGAKRSTSGCGGSGANSSNSNVLNIAHPDSTNSTSIDASAYYTHTVHGTIHKGLYTAATGLLDGYNLRTTLLQLLSKGYSVKVVGHSLGAGTAALVAAELRVTLIAQHLGLVYPDSVGSSIKSDYGSSRTDSTGVNIHYTASTGTTVPEPTSPTSPTPLRGVPRPSSGTIIHPAHTTHTTTTTNTITNTITTPTLLHAIQRISAVIYSSPAFVSADLAEAFLEDRLLVNVVYDKDIIPRFSFKTIQVMAEELKDPDFCAQADKWTLLDKSDFSDYAVSMGKAADIHKPSYGSAADTSTTELATTTTTNTTASGSGSSTSGSDGASKKEETDTALPVAVAVGESSTSATTATPSKPFKPPKPSKPETTNTTTNATTDASSGTGGTSTTASTKNGGTWTGFMSSLAATALDKYQQSTVASSASGSSVDAKGAPDTTTTTTSPTTAPTTAQEQLDATAEAAPLHSTEQKAHFVQQTAHAVGAGSSTEVKQKAPRAHTVTPGPIIHLYKENDGTVHAAVVTHQHSSFQRMEIIPAHSADDHLMGKVREGMRSAMFQHQLLTHSRAATNTSNSRDYSSAHIHSPAHTTGTNTTLPNSTVHTHTSTTTNDTTNTTTTTCDLEAEGSAEVNRTQEERAKFDRYFNIPLHYHHNTGSGSVVSSGDSKRGVESVVEGSVSSGTGVSTGMPGRPNKVYRSISAENANTTTTYTTTNTSTASGVVHSTKSSISATYSTNNTASAGTSGGSFGAESSKNNAGAAGSNPTPTAATSIGRAAQQWVNCSVCSLDVTWPYVLHSDASRAIVAHNCRKCGEVVCSLCAPAGDTLPGDGLNQSYQLQDYRVSLPERGLFAPQRVCVLCYFDT